MKYVLVLALAFASASLAFHDSFDWQSLGGQPDARCSIDLVEADAAHMVVDISVPGFWLGKTVAGGTIWDSIELPDYSPTSEVGLPEVPAVNNMFALPFGTEAVVTVEDVRYATFSGINLVPSQTPEIDMPHNPYPFRIDTEVYETNAFVPARWAETEGSGIWGGISVDRLHVSPVRYNPATGELRVASSIRLRIDFTGNAVALAYPATPAIRNAAAEMLINYDLVADAASAPTDAEAAEYVFVTTSDNLTSIMPLVQFYQGVGYECSVETLPAGSTPDNIKAAITDHYDTGVTRFALIAGDYDALPSYNYGSFVGDYWFACLVGTDYTPEIAVGRLTGDSVQISNQVNKIIAGYYQYGFSDEKTAGVVPSTSVLAAHEQDYPGKYTQCCNQIASYSYATNMTFYKVYPPEGGTASMVSDNINSGIGCVGYRGHGDITVWAWSPGWNKSNIQALTNTFMPPVWNIACLCGKYQTSQECLAESWMWDDNGASGNLAANNPSYTDANHTYMKALYKNLYDYGVYNVAEAINQATIETINAHGTYGQENAEMYLWFGDPAMEIFTNDVANPKQLALTTSPVFVNPGTQTVVVTVTSDGSPVDGATVGLSDGIDGISTVTFHETGTTNSSGQVSFTVNVPSGATHLYTGARLHNYRPVSALINVYPTSIDNTVAGVETFDLAVSLSENPVVSSASLNFSTPVTGHSTVQVFDVTGRTVETLIDGEVSAGNHTLNWTPENISSGVYFIRFTTSAGTVSTQTMVLR